MYFKSWVEGDEGWQCEGWMSPLPSQRPLVQPLTVFI